MGADVRRGAAQASLRTPKSGELKCHRSENFKRILEC